MRNKLPWIILTTQSSESPEPARLLYCSFKTSSLFKFVYCIKNIHLSERLAAQFTVKVKMWFLIATPFSDSKVMNGPFPAHPEVTFQVGLDCLNSDAPINWIFKKLPAYLRQESLLILYLRKLSELHLINITSSAEGLMVYWIKHKILIHGSLDYDVLSLEKVNTCPKTEPKPFVSHS